MKGNKDEGQKDQTRIVFPIIEEEQIQYHDVWNWESENGAWVIAMQQAGLTRDVMETVFKNREQITNLHPGDAAASWWKFKQS
jgi:hypothetical protein